MKDIHKIFKEIEEELYDKVMKRRIPSDRRTLIMICLRKGYELRKIEEEEKKQGEEDDP